MFVSTVLMTIWKHLRLFMCFTVQLPVVTWNEESECLETDKTKKTSLKIQSHPVSSTFAIFDE